MGGALSNSITFNIIILPVNDPPSIRIPPISENMFILDQGGLIHINGALAFPGFNGLALDADLAQHLESTTAYQSGYEMWTFVEPQGYSPSSAKNPYGPGQLDWLRRGLTDIYPGVESSNPRYFTPFREAVYYQADDGVHGAELWRQVGSLQSSMFADLFPGTGTSSPSNLAVWNNELYFAANGVDTSWMVQTQHRDLCNSFRRSGFNNRVHFAVSDENTWVPRRRYDCPLGFHWATTAEGYALFTSDWHNSSITGSRLWHSEAGAEVNQRHGIQEYTQVHQWEKSTSLEMLHEEKVYYQQCGWQELSWGSKERIYFRFSDSEQTGAYKHAAKPDSYRPDIEHQVLSGGQPTLSMFAGIVCIANSDPSSAQITATGNELWKTDGTIEGTLRIDDVYAGVQSSDPAYLTGFGSFLYFAATTSTDGRELWRTRGSIGDAELVPFEVRLLSMCLLSVL